MIYLCILSHSARKVFHVVSGRCFDLSGKLVSVNKGLSVNFLGF